MTTATYQTLPFQIIDVDTGVLLKRGNSILTVNGTGAKNAVQVILTTLSPPGATLEEVRQQFSDPDRKAVGQLIEKLLVNRFVVPSHEGDHREPNEESQTDIFFWHFGDTALSVSERLSSQRITILGVNTISRQLGSILRISGFENVEIVDCPSFRNTRFASRKGEHSQESLPSSLGSPPRNFQEWTANTDAEDFDCLIATSDFGGRVFMKEWNAYCVKHKRFFLPILLQDQTGYIGPLVIPDQTACFQCFLSRQGSHTPPTQAMQEVDECAQEGQAVTGFHPAMASALADMAAFELTKFFSGVVPGWNVGTVLEMNLLTSRMVPRKVLKVPRCPVCSPLITRTPTNPRKSFSFHPIKEQA